MKSTATFETFPSNAAAWREVLSGASESKSPPSPAEEAAIEARSVVVRTGGMAAVRAALEACKPGLRSGQGASAT